MNRPFREPGENDDSPLKFVSDASNLWGGLPQLNQIHVVGKNNRVNEIHGHERLLLRCAILYTHGYGQVHAIKI